MPVVAAESVETDNNGGGFCMRVSRCFPDPQDATCRWMPRDPWKNNKTMGQSQAASASMQEAQKHTLAARNCFHFPSFFCLLPG